jgi:hypothetical protein
MTQTDVGPSFWCCLSSKFGGHAVACGSSLSTTQDGKHFRGLVPDLNFAHSAGAPKSIIQFNGVGGLPTYISFTQGADDKEPMTWAIMMNGLAIRIGECS